MFRRLLPALLLMTFAATALIADEDTEKKSMFTEKVEVIGLLTLDRAVQSITLYNRNQIKLMESTGLKGILNLTPGFMVLNGGHPGQFSYTFARGASVNQTLFLVDGIKISDPSSSIGLNLTFLTPNLVEKMEVVKGPLSNLFGSSAMGGVVNIITRDSEGLEASTQLGSHGTYEGSLNYQKKWDQLSLSLTGNLMRYSDGRENDEFLNRALNAKLKFKNKKISAALMAFASLAASGIPLNMGQPTAERKYSQNNFLFAAPLNVVLGPSSNLDIKLSHNINRYVFEDISDIWSPYLMNESGVTGIKLVWNSEPFKDMVLNWGTDLEFQRITVADSYQQVLDKRTNNYYSTYINSSWDIFGFNMIGSLRFDKYREQSAILSPQIGVSYLLTQSIKLRAAFSRSFRAPTLPERLNPLWGNPDLSAERGKSFEVGLDLSSKYLNLNLVYFDSAYRNLIGFSPVTWRFANLNRADISGIEIGTNFSPAKQILLGVSYSYLHSHDYQNDQELLRRPKHALSGSFNWFHPNFTFSARTVYVGRRLDYNEIMWNVTDNPSFNTFDFSFNVPLIESVSIVARLTNAFNLDYQEVYGYPAPLRRFQLGVRFKNK